MARKIAVEIVGDSRSLERAFSRSEKKSARFGKSLKVGATAALGGLALAAKNGFQELAESQKVTAQTEAGLKSTAGAANVTKKAIEDLATATSEKTGIDDEAVQSSENMLLTFTKIRNVAGKNNDIFNQATTAVGDLATRMNNGAIPSAEQMTRSSIQLGKALNDPVKGVGALRRVGIQFSAAQVKLIKTLEGTGHHLEAQKIILKELNTEFGGSAEAAGKTLPGQLAKARNAFDEMTGSLIVALLPAMQTFATVVAKTSVFLQKHQTLAKVLVTTLAALAIGVFATSAAFKVYTATIRIAAAANFLFGRSAVTAAAGANTAKLSLLGKAGLVGAVGLAAFAMTTLILKTTGLDKKLKSLGASAFDAAAALHLVNDPNSQFKGKTVLSQKSSGFLRRQAARLEAGGLSPAAAAARISAQHPNVARRDINVLAGVGVGGVIQVQSTINLDGRKVGNSTTKHQQTHARRNPPQKRGIVRPSG